MRKYRQRIHYTETDKALMWDRWRKGDSLEKIAQLFDRTHGSVARILRRTGGIRPPKRTRSRRAESATRHRVCSGLLHSPGFRGHYSSRNAIAGNTCANPAGPDPRPEDSAGQTAFHRNASFSREILLIIQHNHYLADPALFYLSFQFRNKGPKL
jgi:hypothetical protein